MRSISDTAKNSQKWRDKKKAEGYVFKNFMLKNTTLKSIAKIGKQFGCDHNSAVDKIVEKFVKSDYQSTITIEQVGGFQERIDGLNNELKSFIEAYIREHYTESEIEKMREFFDEKIKKNKAEFFYSKKYYSTFKNKNPDIIKLKTYEEYKLFLKVFVFSGEEKPQKIKSNEAATISENTKTAMNILSRP